MVLFQHSKNWCLRKLLLWVNVNCCSRYIANHSRLTNLHLKYSDINFHWKKIHKKVPPRSGLCSAVFERCPIWRILKFNIAALVFDRTKNIITAIALVVEVLFDHKIGLMAIRTTNTSSKVDLLRRGKMSGYGLLEATDRDVNGTAPTWKTSLASKWIPQK